MVRPQPGRRRRLQPSRGDRSRRIPRLLNPDCGLRRGSIERCIAAPASYHLGGGVSRRITARRLFDSTRSLQALPRRSGADPTSTGRAFAMLYSGLVRLARAA